MIESRVYVTSGAPVSAQLADAFPSIEGLFELVERALRDADDVDVEYDQQLGYPVRISIDWHINTADDEYTIGVSELVSP